MRDVVVIRFEEFSTRNTVSGMARSMGVRRGEVRKHLRKMVATGYLRENFDGTYTATIPGEPG